MVSIIIYHVGKLTSLLENKHELADTLYLIVLQGVNKLLPIVVLPYLLLHRLPLGFPLQFGEGRLLILSGNPFYQQLFALIC